MWNFEMDEIYIIGIILKIKPVSEDIKSKLFIYVDDSNTDDG